ncbi:MAG: signal peptidase II [Proteobacteria bacterium]|nr:signal peptidase II [Pseudomonadota bacterium]MBU4286548.1 signal peptidase II [Pseudomonadota bacterium]MBU4414156.1 signal peptidase II [Pseudomonadota bacterium]MCG2758560.1 signal peptidase II [Desulfobacteraceae bacterium]
MQNKYLKLAVIAGIVIILDQITKAIVLYSMPLHYSVSVIPGFFNITHIHNPGGAFGFMANQSSVLRSIVFIFFSSLAICLIFYLYKKTPREYSLFTAGFALILGGAIGNLIDRIRFGKVVDFLDFYIGSLHWPAFNIADSAVSIGMVIFIYYFFFKKLPY